MGIGKNSLQNLDVYGDERAVETQAKGTALGRLAAENAAKSIEVQMVVAKRFPRDLKLVEDNVSALCLSKRFAAQSRYSFPRGGQTITGASVRLVEAVAQIYGNIEHSTNEIVRHDGYSECEAYAWDMQNNVRVVRKFNVPHTRDTKSGKQRITDDRDIRELVLNFGARNERACMERVIPKYLIDLALELCDMTLAGDDTQAAFNERVDKCFKLFLTEYGIKAHELEIIVGELKENWTKAIYNKAVGFYNALQEDEVTKKSLLDNAPRVSAKQAEELSALGVPDAGNVYLADFEQKKAEYAEKKKPKKKADGEQEEESRASKGVSADEFLAGVNGGYDE